MSFPWRWGRITFEDGISRPWPWALLLWSSWEWPAGLLQPPWWGRQLAGLLTIIKSCLHRALWQFKGRDFCDGKHLRNELGDMAFESIPAGALGLYTYYERLAKGFVSWWPGAENSLWNIYRGMILQPWPMRPPRSAESGMWWTSTKQQRRNSSTFRICDGDCLWGRWGTRGSDPGNNWLILHKVSNFFRDDNQFPIRNESTFGWLDGSYLFQDLIDEAVVDIDATWIGSGKVSG